MRLTAEAEDIKETDNKIVEGKKEGEKVSKENMQKSREVRVDRLLNTIAISMMQCYRSCKHMLTLNKVFSL